MRKLLASLCLLASACATTGGVAALRDEEPVREQLLAADRAFDKAAREKGVEGFKSFLMPDVADIGGNTRGAEAMAASWAPLLSGKGATIAWQPTGAGFVESAQVGYTVGRYQVTQADQVKTGAYTTVWKRQADGSWRVAIDGGCPECVKCGPAR